MDTGGDGGIGGGISGAILVRRTVCRLESPALPESIPLSRDTIPGMNVQEIAPSLVRLLADRRIRIVLAESCTGGMVAAELAMVPGVSDWFCGSAVTYRSDTKMKWLAVKQEDIDRFTAVSSQVAQQMAGGVLSKTPEADIAVSITGHLGPQAPEGFDGLVFIGWARRDRDAVVTQFERIQLKTTGRQNRQIEATSLVLGKLRELVENA